MQMGYFEKYQVDTKDVDVERPLAGATDQELVAELSRRLGFEIKL